MDWGFEFPSRGLGQSEMQSIQQVRPEATWQAAAAEGEVVREKPPVVLVRKGCKDLVMALFGATIKKLFGPGEVAHAYKFQ